MESENIDTNQTSQNKNIEIVGQRRKNRPSHDLHFRRFISRPVWRNFIRCVK